VEREQHREAQARLESDYLSGALSADEYMRLRRELHERVSGEAAPLAPAALRYASWGRRAAALLLDTMILFAVLFIAPVSEFGSVLASLLIPVLYHWLLVGARGQTVGKMALGIRIVRAADGGPVGYGRALARVVCWWLLGAFFLVPLLLAYLWPLWDKRNQTLYDKVVDTVVVTVR
jgi:uncharacterized RDD family membrane protein YckC